MSSKSILIISSYTVSNLVRFKAKFAKFSIEDIFQTTNSINMKFDHRSPVTSCTSWVVQHWHTVIQDGGQPPL